MFLEMVKKNNLFVTLFLKNKTFGTSFEEHLSLLLFCFLVATSFKGFTQDVEEIQAPLDIPMALSGNFGEFRKTHFHAGLDIKTEGRQGLKVRSVSDGWVHRIRVSTSGYGKALYVMHSNGLLSVYAHLKKFAPAIEAFVKAAQYKKESFEIQLFPKLQELKVKKGALIAYSGNTGGSFGPHLHFETRDAKNQHPLNPLRFLKDFEDTERPRLQALYVYEKDEWGKEFRTEIPMDKVNDSLFRGGLLEASGTISFGLQMFDRQNRSYNKNGIYAVQVNVNGIPHFQYQFDEMSFSDSKYIPLFIDYDAQTQENIKIQRLIRHVATKVNFLKENAGDGYLPLEEGKSYQIIIHVSDFHGNTTSVELYCKGFEKNEAREVKNTPNEQISHEISPELDYLFEYEPWTVYFPQKNFFEKTSLLLKSKGDSLIVDTDRYPVRTPFTLRFKLKDEDSTLSKQYGFARLKKDKYVFVPTTHKGSELEAEVKVLGTYFLTRDSLAPQITPANFKEGQRLNNFKFLKVTLEDDFSGIQSYRATINGKWVLFEYEPKNNSLIYEFSDHTFKSGKQHLEIIAKDYGGNETHFKTFFYRVYKK